MTDCMQQSGKKASIFDPERWKNALILMRFHKPIGVFLLLWPMLWALWLAGGGSPAPRLVVIFVLGCVLMRAAGCVINDLADRRWDQHVARTAKRPLAAGTLPVKSAKMLVAVLCVLAFALVCLTNLQTILFSVIGLALATLYPFTKRFSHWPQFYLGCAFAWAIPMAYSAQHVAMNSTALLLFIATCCWAMAYDTAYAMVDREYDRKLPIKSTALLLGSWDRCFIALMHTVVLLLLCIIGMKNHLTWIFYSSLMVAALLSVYQQVLIFHREPSRCLRAFLNNHYFGFVVFLGLFFST